MKSFFKLFIILSFLLVVTTDLQAQGKDCSCPKVTCGPCQKQVSIGKVVKFCDWGDINVCKKVICENVNFYFGCLSNHNKKMTPKDDKEAGEIEFAYDQGREKKPKSVKKQKRGIASQKAVSKRSNKVNLETPGRIEVDNDSRIIEGENYSDQVVGKVVSFKGAFEVLHRGQKISISKKQKFYIGDEIYNPSSENTNLTISFSEGEVAFKLLPKSKLIMHDPHSIVGRFQPFIYLVHGGVDYTVNFKSGSFDILAGQILARSNGGKHRALYEMDNEGLKVKVESLKNSVEVIRAKDLSGKKINVEAGQFISWVSETPAHLFTMDEKQALAGDGFITPVFQMSKERRQKLGLIPAPKKSLFSDWSEKEVPKGDRDVASADELCQAPAAGFQQCAWSCEGNDKGAKTCLAQREAVHCVRRVCNAAGQWGVPTAFASSYRDLCPAEGVRVGDCSP